MFASHAQAHIDLPLVWTARASLGVGKVLESSCMQHVNHTHLHFINISVEFRMNFILSAYSQYFDGFDAHKGRLYAIFK